METDAGISKHPVSRGGCSRGGVLGHHCWMHEGSESGIGFGLNWRVPCRSWSGEEYGTRAVTYQYRCSGD